MKKILAVATILIILKPWSLPAQSIYLNPDHEVYSFLKRMEARQLLIDYKDAAKPLTRETIAKALKSLEPQVDNMTRVERQSFEFFKTEFRYELLRSMGDNEPSEGRWHLYSKELTKGILNFDINYQLSKAFTGKEVFNKRAQGMNLYGYAFQDIGFAFRWMDFKETGDNVDFQKLYTPQPGFVPNILDSSRKRLEYTETDVQFTWKTGDFTFSLEKNSNVWGYGKSGSVIFSKKAPSYPQIKMRVPLSDDIDFVYFHGELQSNVLDSSRSYSVRYFNPSFESERIVDHTKYIAAHQIEFSLFHGVDISIGESVVYSDKGPLLIYLIPVMFFKGAEWYNRDKDNIQLFGSFDLNLIKNVNTYFSLFIDELNTDDLFNSDKSRRQIAFTGGVQVFDLPFVNTDMTLEYTRANPSVYNHKYPSLTFTNNSYSLGHWIGENADDLFFEFGFTPYHSLRVTAFSEIFRKGAPTDIYYQYQVDQGGLGFLHGLQRVDRSYGVSAKYQPLRDVFLNFRMTSRTIENHLPLPIDDNGGLEMYFSAGVGLF